MIIEALVPAAIAVFGGIAVLLFFKFKKPPKKEFLLTREKSFGSGEGPTIEYRGVGGSPYRGKMVELRESENKANVVLENEDDDTTIELMNLNTGELGNIRSISTPRELLHGIVKLACNKDSTGEILVGPDGAVWDLKERKEEAVVADLLAEARAKAKAVDEVDDLIQYRFLRKRPVRYAGPPSEEDEVEVGKFG